MTRKRKDEENDGSLKIRAGIVPVRVLADQYHFFSGIPNKLAWHYKLSCHWGKRMGYDQGSSLDRKLFLCENSETECSMDFHDKKYGNDEVIDILRLTCIEEGMSLDERLGGILIKAVGQDYQVVKFHL